MLSLIICSRTPRISEELEKNIAETIGCDYELVVIDNSKNKYSIFSAYNEGVRRSKGDILCFMHDDILYKTTGWGTKVEKMLEDESIGIVGVIGSYVMTKDYGYWDMMAPWVTGIMIVGTEYPITHDANAYNDIVGDSLDVATLDGTWLCCRKKIFNIISFDEQTYTGYHMYDMDICMQALVNGYKNAVLRDVVIRHYSHAQMNLDFCNGLELFHKKWNNYLPICKGVKLSERLLKDFDFTYVRRLQIFMRNSSEYLDSYQSVCNSTAYRLGCFLLKPIYFIKKLIGK